MCLFSLNLADFDQNSGYLDYYSISDNGDRDKIFATVISGLSLFFFNEYPRVYVYATGTGMSKYYDLMEADFSIWG